MFPCTPIRRIRHVLYFEPLFHSSNIYVSSCAPFFLWRSVLPIFLLSSTGIACLAWTKIISYDVPSVVFSSAGSLISVSGLRLCTVVRVAGLSSIFNTISHASQMMSHAISSAPWSIGQIGCWYWSSIVLGFACFRCRYDPLLCCRGYTIKS